MKALNLLDWFGQRKPDLEIWTQSQDSFSPKLFQTGGERCPVALFRQYINDRPRNLRASGPFCLSIKYNSGPGDETWYKVQPMGENKINSMMKNIISQTSLQSSEKRFTNHSARKTLVSKMKKANLERSSIAKVTGHRNIQCLDDYDEADEDEQRQRSWAISKGNSTPKPVPVAGSSSGPCASNAVIPHMMSSQAQNLINSFINCTVTFNLNNKASPDKPRKRRFHFIESDSDTDWTIPWTVWPDFERFCALKMRKFHFILLFWSYAVVLTERTMSFAGFE